MIDGFHGFRMGFLPVKSTLLSSGHGLGAAVSFTSQGHWTPKRLRVGSTGTGCAWTTWQGQIQTSWGFHGKHRGKIIYEWWLMDIHGGFMGKIIHPLWFNGKILQKWRIVHCHGYQRAQPRYSARNVPTGERSLRRREERGTWTPKRKNRPSQGVFFSKVAVERPWIWHIQLIIIHKETGDVTWCHVSIRVRVLMGVLLLVFAQPGQALQGFGGEEGGHLVALRRSLVDIVQATEAIRPW